MCGLTYTITNLQCAAVALQLPSSKDPFLPEILPVEIWFESREESYPHFTLRDLQQPRLHYSANLKSGGV
jgi:hypothetical protein